MESPIKDSIGSILRVNEVGKSDKIITVEAIQWWIRAS